MIKWVLVIAAGLVLPGLAWAEESVSPGLFAANNAWMMLCAGLVFIMHLGFATLESGLTRAKNTTNVLFKNTFIICAGILTYALFGFNLMYPGFAEGSLGVLSFSGFGIATDAAAFRSNILNWSGKFGVQSISQRIFRSDETMARHAVPWRNSTLFHASLQHDFRHAACG